MKAKQVLFSLDDKDKNVVHWIYEHDHNLLAIVKKDFSIFHNTKERGNRNGISKFR